MSKCNRCGETVRWVKSQKGKNVPLNIDAVKLDDLDGDVEVVWNATSEHFQATARALESEDDVGPYFISHFNTCGDTSRKETDTKLQAQIELAKDDIPF